MAGKGLSERLAEGVVICAEGYLFELERRGYLQAGAFVPEAVLEHPEVVEQLHRDFVHAGSDVVEAFTYYAHREKLRIIGREGDLEKINRQALAIAKRVADETGTLFAGNICNTNIWDPDDAASKKKAQGMFEEQVGWAVDSGVDFVIGETYGYVEEALLALRAIKRAGKPAVMTMTIHRSGRNREGLEPEECLKRLADAGADVVGFNCIRGPWTMLPYIEKAAKMVKNAHLAALPVPYRTTPEQPTFQSLRDGAACACLPGEMPFPVALDPFTCNRFEMAEYAQRAAALGVRYVGVCCGAMPHHIRAVAEALGRHPPASRYSADMSKHAFFGTDPTLLDKNRQYSKEL
jgi:betaine-homocysteine S-methyltransferase